AVALLAVMQGRHRALAFGNIQHGPDKADGLPVHVEQDAPTRQQPARPAAHADDGTVSNGVVAALFGIERLLDRFMCLPPVFRMRVSPYVRWPCESSRRARRLSTCQHSGAQRRVSEMPISSSGS